MNVDKLNRDLKDFWNEHFKSIEPQAINKNDFDLNNALNQQLEFIGHHCERVLDFGTGGGYALFAVKMLGKKIKEGIGIDTSKHAIDFCQKTAALSKVNNLSFVQADQDYLEAFDSSSFDAIICSNVLDVVPYQTSTQMISALDRVLKPGGYFLLKLNFYLTDALIERIKMKEIAKNTFTLNNVLRGVNLTHEEWLERFSDYDLIIKDTYPRVKNGPEDRLLLLRKK